MRRNYIFLIVFLILLSFGCHRKPKTSCVYGNSIPPDILDAGILAGDSIVNALENGQLDKIYDEASEMVKRAQTREQFKLIMQGIMNNLSSIEFSRLVEAYYLTNKTGKRYNVVSVACNLEQEGVNDIYQVPPNSEIISLIYNSMSGSESLHIFLELIKEGERWKLFSLIPGLETLRQKRADDYVNMARKAREENKPKLALLYYQIAFLLSDFSPNVIEFVSSKIAEEMSQVKTEYMPIGNSQIWTPDDNSRFEVYNVGVFIEKGEPWVNIDWLAASLNDPQKLEQESEELFEFAFPKFSEAREFFVGIVVSAHPRNPSQVAQVFRKFRRFSEIKK